MQVVNRQRGDQPAGRPAAQLQLLPSQNRGQDLDQPITPPPQPRRPLLQPSSFDEAVLSDIFTPIPVRDFPQPSPSAPQPPPPQFAAAVPAAPREVVRTAAAPSSSEGFSNFPSRDPASNPARGRTRLVVRPASGAVEVANGAAQAAQPARVPVRANLASARQTGGAGAARQLNAQRSGQTVFQQQQPTREESAPAAAQPSFSSFPAAPSPAIAPAFLPAQSPAGRPALTFQDDSGRPAGGAVLPLATPTTLPKSALEIVDFNQLLQEFQGSQQQRGRATQQQQQQDSFPARFLSEQQQQQQQVVVPAFQQARFSTNNFPVRF
jgi:hypothetical protein